MFQGNFVSISQCSRLHIEKASCQSSGLFRTDCESPRVNEIVRDTVLAHISGMVLRDLQCTITELFKHTPTNRHYT